MRRHLVDYKDQRKVHDHLLTVTEMVKSPHSGIPYVEYKADWDDQKVGELFGFSKLQIRDFRREQIGKENPGGRGKPHNRMAMIKRIEALEARFNALEDILAKFGISGLKREHSSNGPVDGPLPF